MVHHLALYDSEVGVTFPTVNIFQENEESKTAAVSGQEDLITDGLRDVHACYRIATSIVIV
jgi:hypothetical protein